MLRPWMIIGIVTLATGILGCQGNERTTDRDVRWNQQPGSGQAIEGDFSEQVLTLLDGRDLHMITQRWTVKESLPPGQEGLERATLSTPEDQAADGYRYAVIVDREGRQFWVERSGGLAGKTIYFGPATVEDGRLILTDCNCPG